MNVILGCGWAWTNSNFMCEFEGGPVPIMIVLLVDIEAIYYL